jgi:hypothetical protein
MKMGGLLLTCINPGMTVYYPELNHKTQPIDFDHRTPLTQLHFGSKIPNISR